MSLDEGLSDLIRDIYCADPEGLGWDTIRAEILRQTGACSGLCTVVDLKRGEMAEFRAFGRESSGVADAISESLTSSTKILRSSGRSKTLMQGFVPATLLSRIRITCPTNS